MKIFVIMDMIIDYSPDLVINYVSQELIKGEAGLPVQILAWGGPVPPPIGGGHIGA